MFLKWRSRWYLHEYEELVFDELYVGCHRSGSIDEQIDLVLNHRAEQLPATLLQPVNSGKAKANGVVQTFFHMVTPRFKWAIVSADIFTFVTVQYIVIV